MFEWLLVRCCAPTLRGIKSSNLFMYKGNDARTNVDVWAKKLNAFGLKIKILKIQRDKALIYIYRERLIKNILSKRQTCDFLEKYGYKNFADIEKILSYLSKRMEFEDFPHEIGVFLDYPIDDVKMFIDMKGKNYKYSGIWKVYYDEEHSKKLFKDYEDCTLKFSDMFLRGENILSLCSA